MDQILTLREKRAKAWDAAKAFLDTKRGTDGMISAEDAATYDKMEADVVGLGHEIERLERQAALDRDLSQPTRNPLTEKPGSSADKGKTGRASDDYQRCFWNMMRSKNPTFEVMNALQVGVDSEGGVFAPDEFERTLIEALEEQNIFRGLAKVITTSSGDRKIPVVASKGSAAWIDEETAYPESDDAFGMTSIGAFKLATMIKVSEELLNDSVYNAPPRRSPANGRSYQRQGHGGIRYIKAQRIVGCPYVFATQTGKYLSYRNLLAMMEKACETVGVEHSGLHALRNSFASNLYARGVEVKIISKLLGHASLTNTKNHTFLRGRDR